MPVTVTTRPLYLNANTNVYNAWDLRRYTDADPAGAGVADWESMRVQPRQAGANMSVDIGKTAVGLMAAFVRGGTRGGQGLYRVDNVDVTAPTADNYLAQLNMAVAASDPTNPRLDQLVLVVVDAMHAGGSNLAYIDCLTGTPGAGVTLDNRTGAAATPATFIPLADLLITAAKTSVIAGDIRDRRPFALFGTVPAANAGIDQVVPELTSSIGPGFNVISAAMTTNAAFGAFYVPRRIVATKLRWKYGHGATAWTGNYNFGICDSSGRLIAQTGVVAATGAANSIQIRQETIPSTVFDVGTYYIGWGLTVTAGTASLLSYALSVATGAGALGAIAPNLALYFPASGTTLPASLAAATDVSSIIAAATIVPVPQVVLSAV